MSQDTSGTEAQTPRQGFFADIWEPCAHWNTAPQFDCKGCGRTFCSTCEGGSERSDLCDGCFADAEVAP